MTENEAIYELKLIKHTRIFIPRDEVWTMAIKALEEIQEYRAIGTVEELHKLHKDFDFELTINKTLEDELGYYREIGTIEEFKALKEKSVAKKPIEKVLPYSEEFGFNSEWKCPTCGAYVGYFSEGMSEPEQMEYCNECGQHIAKDWTEI